MFDISAFAHELAAFVNTLIDISGFADAVAVFGAEAFDISVFTNAVVASGSAIFDLSGFADMVPVFEGIFGNTVFGMSEFTRVVAILDNFDVRRFWISKGGYCSQ